MLVPDAGIPAEALITVIKNSIRRAEVSAASEHADLRVSSVQLILRVVAAAAQGGGVDFRVPFLGMRLHARTRATRRDTHTLDLALTVPATTAGHEIRDADVETVLVDAITTIRAVMASAAVGEDPWILTTSTVDITFAVTKEGSISLGIDADLASEVTSTLRLTLTPAAQPAPERQVSRPHGGSAEPP